MEMIWHEAIAVQPHAFRVTQMEETPDDCGRKIAV